LQHYRLADTADGFGGGQNSEDILRIMRDHAIGSYGGLALVVLVALKVTAYAAVLKQSNWISALILTPALGRWSILLLTATLPYARPCESVAAGMGKRPLFWGTLAIAVVLVSVMSGRALVACAAVIAVTGCFGIYCHHRIAGITGDTLGAKRSTLRECRSAHFSLGWVSAMTRFWLIRHGEPAEEARHRCYGSLDVGLSEKGRTQMAETAQYLKTEPVAAIYTSPSSRALDSARILAAAQSCPFEVVADLREIHFGDFEGLPYDAIAARYPDLYRQWMETPTEVRFPNGEELLRNARTDSPGI
jgi:hypothetical protein